MYLFSSKRILNRKKENNKSSSFLNESSFKDQSLSSKKLISSQKKISDSIIQLAPWLNVPAKFRTDNGINDIPNSEYIITEKGSIRFAPINEFRAPRQYFEEFDYRSYLYIDPLEDQDLNLLDQINYVARDTVNKDKMVKLGAGSLIYGYVSPKEDLLFGMR